jgi:O-antigen/teichoic acid export membrane protein
MKIDINTLKISSQKNIIYIKNTIILLSDNIIKIICGFIISIFIARYFGPGRFGQINYVVAFIGILQVFVLFGFEGIVLKDIGLGLYPESRIMGTVIKTRLLLALIVFSIGSAIFYFYFDKSLLLIYFILGIQLFVCSLHIFKQWYQIKSLNKYTVIASQISFITVFILKIALIILSKDVIWYAYILTLGSIIEAILLFFFFKKNAKGVVIEKLDISYVKHLLKLSLPLLFQNFAIVIYMKIDQIMIGKMLSAYELGLYSISVTISELVYFIPMAISNAVYPKIAQAKKDGKDYETLLVKLGSLNISICLLFAIICTLFAPFLITTLYGEAYSAAGNVIQIHSWAGVFVAIGVSHGSFIIFNNMQTYSLIGTVFAAIINIVGNFIYIPMWGINGAAITTILSYFFSAYFFYFLIKDKRTFILRTKSLFFRF